MKMNRSKQRSGVTLLMVMSIIVLFLLMGTTFVIISNNFLKSARQKSKFRLKGDEGQVLVERALYDIIRGPDLDNIMSPLRGHSLLGDMYGFGFKSEIASANINGPFVDATLGPIRTILDQQDVSATLPASHGGLPGMLHGLVLTVTSGEFTGLTTRIVNNPPNPANPAANQVILKPVWSDKGPITVADLVGAEVVINGRPFSGTGAGVFNPQGSNSAALTGGALRPNQSGRTRTEMINNYLVRNENSTTAANSASVNESYDAPDFQNMFLAGVHEGRRGTYVIPSFAKTAWRIAGGGPGGGPGGPGLPGGPSPYAYRGNLTGPDFAVFGSPDIDANEPPEVDNDGDGTPDSIWMDIGLPIQSDGSGRIYKPLVAALITDLDGKVNVNAHGNLTQLRNDRYRGELPFFNPNGANIPTNRRHHGQGYGPPEIDLSLIVGDAGALALMQGNGTWNGRYGVDGYPGQPGVRESWSAYQHFGYPQNNIAANPPGTVGRHYQSSAMDIHGRFAVGFPALLAPGTTAPIGMPVMDLDTSALADEITDSAYEMNLAPEPFSMPGLSGVDQPFSLIELERIYRQYDPDTNLLPPRLLRLAQAGHWNPTEPALLTTDSYEVPTTFSGVADRLYKNLVAGGMLAADARTQVAAMIAPEMLQGLPLNINRPFGNGVDSDGNGAIDDAGDAGAPNGQSVTHPSGSAFKLDVDRNGSDDSSPLEGRKARNNLARYIYMLILLSTEGVDRDGDGQPAYLDIAEEWYDFNNSGGPADGQDLIDFRRVAAQWAINLVDFRDPDSIMTPFEVDLNPWDGWRSDCDGNLANSSAPIVWGCERPELLLTETFATHDRRTQDLDFSPPQGDDELTTDAAPDNDEDFDSHLLPNVSAFFELYNPWAVNVANQNPSRDVYDAGGSGVDLQRSPNGTPVWRLLVVDGDDGNASPHIRTIDPDTDNQLEQQRLTAATKRRIYFVEPNAGMNPATIGNEFAGDQVYYPEAGIAVPPVAPGQYAVAGSAGVRQVGNRYDTYFGRRTSGTATDPVELETLTQRYSLNPSNSTVESYKWENGSFVTETRQNVVAIPIGVNQARGPRNLGVSDPAGGYTVGAGPVALPIEIRPINDGFKYVDATDQNAPLDYSFDEPVDRSQNSEDWDVVREDGLTSAFRTVHLQRLADPTRPFNQNAQDPEYNPYRTVDSNSVDLFSFNGATSDQDPASPGVANTPMLFSAFERRSGRDLLGRNRQRNPRRKILFKTDLDGNTRNSISQAADGSHHLNRELSETLGGLNDIYNPAETNNTEGPFAWLTWNNRPYVSHLEMANVPHTSSSRLLCKFDVDETLIPPAQGSKFTGNNQNVYNPPVSPSTLTGSPNYAGHFGHLLNFYADRSGGSENKGLRLQPLMDLVAVPSRFMGSDEWLNPATTPGLTPPFDRVSRYRNPGKINLNTINDARVWNAVMGASVGEAGYTDTNGGVDFQEWKDSMELNPDPSDQLLKPWGNPYRSAESFNWVPGGYVVKPADAGLFRREDPSEANSDPLFDYKSNANQNDYRSYHNTARNAYFKYDMRQRLGNLVTTRSSVYAIWITVGLFEVNAQGQVTTNELGSDSGEVRRYRGFFVVDRSIPVAFEPGKNHNVERAIRVSSFLE